MLHKIYYKWEDFDKDVQKIVKHIKENNWKIDCIYSIPRGGLILGTVLSYALKVPLFNNNKYNNVLVVDDISDSGKTLKNVPFIERYKTITLHIKKNTKFVPDFYCDKFERDCWLVYPWEKKDSKMLRDKTNEK